MPDVAKKDGVEKIAYQGRIVEIVEQPMKIGAKSMTFESARRSPGTRLLVVDKPAKKILLSKEFRSELDDYDYRLSGGKVFDSLKEYNEFLSQGKDILEPATERAKIEAKEEAGIIAKNADHIYTSINGSTMIWDLLYFVIDDWEQAEQELDGWGEDIEPVWVSFDEAKEYALKHMSEDRSAIVLLRWLEQN